MASEIDTSAEVMEDLAANLNAFGFYREAEVGRLREALVRLCAWGRMTPSTPDERSAEQREGWGAFDQARAALATPAPEDAA